MSPRPHLPTFASLSFSHSLSLLPSTRNSFIRHRLLMSSLAITLLSAIHPFPQSFGFLPCTSQVPSTLPPSLPLSLPPSFLPADSISPLKTTVFFLPVPSSTLLSARYLSSPLVLLFLSISGLLSHSVCVCMFPTLPIFIFMHREWWMNEGLYGGMHGWRGFGGWQDVNRRWTVLSS